MDGPSANLFVASRIDVVGHAFSCIFWNFGFAELDARGRSPKSHNNLSGAVDGNEDQFKIEKVIKTVSLGKCGGPRPSS